MQFGNPLRHHPDTGLDLYDLKVPHWDTLLNLAASCYEMSGLGYIGTDMVLDKFRGPMLLELNARPGLAIQIANGRGLVPNLKTIEKLGQVKMNVEQRVNFARITSVSSTNSPPPSAKRAHRRVFYGRSCAQGARPKADPRHIPWRRPSMARHRG